MAGLRVPGFGGDVSTGLQRVARITLTLALSSELAVCKDVSLPFY